MALVQRLSLPHGASAARSRKLLSVCASSNGDRSRSSHGKGFDANNKQRRRGRPAWMRSPYDSPLRDGNRDRLIGLLTERATKTLMVYLMETNVNVYSWLVSFYKENPIPKNGSWDEVSGESFLRKLLAMPIEEAKYNTGRDSLFDNVQGIGVDPRSIAQRIMDIRTQLSEEFIQELKAIAEENSLLLRESLQTSLSSTLELPEAKRTSNSNSSSSGSSRASPAGTRPASPERKPDLTSHRPSFKTPTPAAWRRNKAPDSSRPGSPSSITGSSGTYSLSNDDRPASADPENAANVAALNAALNASFPSDAAASHPELADAAAGAAAGGVDSSAASPTAAPTDDKVNVKDAIAQLKRSLDVDVAMLTDWTSLAQPSDSTSDSSSSGALPAPVLDTEEVVVTPSTDELAASAAAFDAASTEAAVAETLAVDVPPATAALESAAAAVLNNPGRLPKGWGPRLGVGFSQIRNNIVSIKKLAAKAVPAVEAAVATQQLGADQA